MSSSGSAPTIQYGIGGRIARPLPWWRPVRIVAMNMSSVHEPRPVSLSGVRFAVKLTPHGPAHAVFVADMDPIHGPDGGGGGGITISAGCPVSARDMSISGPRGPIFQGVWQSLQPIVFTSCAPRSTRACFFSGVTASWPARRSAPENAAIAITITVVVAVVRFMAELDGEDFLN